MCGCDYENKSGYCICTKKENKAEVCKNCKSGIHSMISWGKFAPKPDIYKEQTNDR